MASTLIILKPKWKTARRENITGYAIKIAVEQFFFNEKSKNRIQFIGMIFDNKKEKLFIDESLIRWLKSLLLYQLLQSQRWSEVIKRTQKQSNDFFRFFSLFRAKNHHFVPKIQFVSFNDTEQKNKITFKKDLWRVKFNEITFLLHCNTVNKLTNKITKKLYFSNFYLLIPFLFVPNRKVLFRRSK